MLKILNRGDRFQVKENGLRGTIDATDSCYDFEEEIHEYHVVWDHTPGRSHSYMHHEVKDLWEKLDAIASQQQVGIDYAPADTNDRLPRGSYGVMPGEAVKKECEHRWVEVGFTRTKTVCYYCDMEKP